MDKDESLTQRKMRPLIEVSEEHAAQLSKSTEELTVSERILIESSSEKDRISEVKVYRFRLLFMTNITKYSFSVFVKLYCFVFLTHNIKPFQ